MHFLKQIGTEKIGENAVPNVPEKTDYCYVFLT